MSFGGRKIRLQNVNISFSLVLQDIFSPVRIPGHIEHTEEFGDCRNGVASSSVGIPRILQVKTHLYLENERATGNTCNYFAVLICSLVGARKCECPEPTKNRHIIGWSRFLG
jgi:hypothetical protein